MEKQSKSPFSYARGNDIYKDIISDSIWLPPIYKSFIGRLIIGEGIDLNSLYITMDKAKENNEDIILFKLPSIIYNSLGGEYIQEKVDEFVNNLIKKYYESL